MTLYKLCCASLRMVARTPYDPTDYQRVLFVAESFAAMERQVVDWLERA